MKTTNITKTLLALLLAAGCESGGFAGRSANGPGDNSTA